MNAPIRNLSSVVAILLAAGLSSGQEKTVSRYIEFRDGTVMRLPVVNEPWRVTLITRAGQIKTQSMLPDQIQALTLTAEQDFGKKRQLLAFVQQLGSDEFTEREDAWTKLYKMGPSICPDLRACLQLTEDVEIQARLQDLIHKLHPGDPKLIKSKIVFDRFEIKDTVWGYLEDSPVTVLVKGKSHPLGRKDVARVSVTPPTSRVAIRRIGDKDMPPDCVEEPFEVNPLNGQPLKGGDNIDKLFVGKGLVFSTPLKNSFISVNTFAVAGKSGNLSIANHEPLWEGEVVLRFVQPGKEHIPAAVDYFGCYAAAVVPGGTTVIAYDLQDRELGKIHSQQHSTEFLGMHSEIPIHKIRILPNPEVDANFTIDDVSYRFAATVQASHPDKILVEMLAGDSILCKDVSLKGDLAELHGLPGGLPDLTVPRADMLRVNPSQTPKVQKQEGLFAELSDGSILFAAELADKRKMPIFTRYGNLLKDRKDLVGVWTTKSGRKLPPVMARQKPFLWNNENQDWQEVEYLRFLEELVLWKTSGGKFGSAGYVQFTTLWFAEPKLTPEPGSWHIQTTLGEDLVLPKNQPVSGKLSSGLALQWRGQQLQLPAAQIMSLYQVPAVKEMDQ